MTGPGASIYVGFFVLAASWRRLPDGPLTKECDDQGRRTLIVRTPPTPKRKSEGSSPWLASHSSQK